jgi:hypothetical protein
MPLSKTHLKYVVLSGIILNLLIGLLSTTAFADTSQINVRLSRFGDVTLYEGSNPANNIDLSLLNLAPVMGEVQYGLDPLSLLLGATINTDHPQILNRANLEAFLRNPPTKYMPIAGYFLPATQRVDSDGTIETPITGSPTLEDVENFTRWFRLREWADADLAAMDPTNRAIVDRWIQGAQKAARDTEASFYGANPELRNTKIVESFYSLSTIDFIRAYAWAAQENDYYGIIRLMGGISGWLQSHKVGELIPGISTRATYSAPFQFPIFTKPQDLAIGASNGAAFTFIPSDSRNERVCTVMGEPHQMSNYDYPGAGRQQMKLFRGYASKEDGKLIPFFLSSYPTLPAFTGLQFTPYSATTGTAGPSATSLMFLVETDGQKYFDGATWHSFTRIPLAVTRNGVQSTIYQYQVPDFGTVFSLIRDPNSGKYYVLTIRLKSPTSFLDGFWSRLRAGLKNDGEGYIAALEKNVPKYGEAGCAPARFSDPPNAKRMAYFSMNQGKVDQVVNPSEVQPLSINWPTQGLRKIGTLPQAMCIGQFYATSDNGSLAGGCKTPPSVLSYLDPGYQTFRQLHFKNWAETHYNTPIARSDVLQFGTSTESILVRRLLDVVIASIRRFGAQATPTESVAIVNIVAEMLSLHDGAVHDNLDQILIYFLYSELTEAILRGTIPSPSATKNYLLFTSTSKQDMESSLTISIATTIITKLIEGINFIANKCLPNGIQKYSDALSINISGTQVASRFSGPGYDSRSNGGFQWGYDSNGRNCSLKLFVSSPLKYVATEDEVYYLPLGPVASTLSTEPGLYNSSNQSWGEYWNQHNRDGSGFGGINSYRRFPLSIISGPPANDPDTIQSLTVVVTSSTAVPTPSSSPTNTPTPSTTPTPTNTVTPTPSQPPNIPIPTPSQPGPSATPTSNPTPGSNQSGEMLRSTLNNLSYLTSQLKLVATKQKARRNQRKIKTAIRAGLNLLSAASKDYTSHPISSEHRVEVTSKTNAIISKTTSLLRDRQNGKLRMKREIARTIEALKAIIRI